MIVVLLWMLASAQSAEVKFEFRGRGSVPAVQALLARVLNNSEAASMFDLKLVDKCEGAQPRRSPLCFQVSTSGSGSPIKVRATSGPDLARGCAEYMRKYLNMSFSWQNTGGNQITLMLPSEKWPSVNFTSFRNVNISYYQNVVASSYSHVWWSFVDWEKFLDWQALSGINVALAYTGQEEVYRKVFNTFGVTDAQFGNYSNGPAWLSWSRGQSMHGVGTFGNRPLPQQWMTAQWALQKQILARMRELGIVSVLPAFQGNVPQVLKSLFPAANITLQGTGRHWAAWLDSLDPLFGKIGDAVMKQLIADFGTDHWYEADGYFTAGSPPWLPRYRVDWKEREVNLTSSEADPTSREVDPVEKSAREHAAAAYLAMNRTDPDAIWLYQGWILGGDDSFTRGLTSAVEKGRLVISDMRCEMPGGAEWKDNNFSFNGAPFIWGVLHDFGGNLGMWGSLPVLNADPFEAFAIASSIAGIGFLPEGINQNPVYYTFLLDTAWTQAPVDLSTWLQSYALSRSGSFQVGGNMWLALANTTYGGDQGPHDGNDRCSASDGITSYPLAEQEGVAPIPDWYNTSVLWYSWGQLVNEWQPSSSATPAHFDLVNLGRECLAKLSNSIFWKLDKATTVQEVSSAGQAMLELQVDIDKLLCANGGFSLGQWLTSARLWGGNDTDLSDYMEWSARSQVTSWLPACEVRPTSNTTMDVCGSRSDLNDYANKQWGGLVASFHTGRIQCFVSQAASDFARGAPLDYYAYNKCLDDWTWTWQHDFGGKLYPICWEPTGDAIAISKELLEKYSPLLPR